ncbi:Hypothetical predicted protein [Mytilus galloprovincialis]|uniref:Uncharacterized protein n=1 Tax=Mytilus galloprovincialis TaxID=29158 RepID=A0A8B6CDX2_MYTGA|nr:Hypothetical predicted protein [Mytilus galloprovincialis]
MPEVTKTRELSILTKTPTHYLVKYTGSKTYKVRIRDLFRLKGERQSKTSRKVPLSKTGPSESTTRPSVSTSRTVPPTSLTPTQPTMYAGSNFPDNDKIIKLLHVIIEQNTKLEHKLDAMNRRLMTIEVKQDTMIDLLQRCDKFLEYET